MLLVLVSFTVFLHSYVFSAFRLAHRYVFGFQINDGRNTVPENVRVDSKPTGFQKNGEDSEPAGFRSGSSEMNVENHETTRNSVFCSVSMGNVDVDCIPSANLDDDPEKRNNDIFDCLGVSKELMKSGEIAGTAGDGISGKAGVVDSKSTVSNVFDLLPEPEVQVLWEDYSVPSDSESDPGNSTTESPTMNQQLDSSSKEIKPDINARGNNQLENPINLGLKEDEIMENSDKSTVTHFQEKPSMLNFNYHYELNYLPDHQDIVHQLEIELRNAKTGGLPTIFEEETETAEELNEKLMYEEKMGEIKKVYMIYAKKMRELDILNNQSMHAVGLLQLKYPLQSISESKSFVHNNKSPLPQNPWQLSGKAQTLAADRRLEYIGDLQRDMELVYMGQVCLSWEMLQWQLRKALELSQCDSRDLHQYNQAVSEFHLFLVLLKRFMEDERFHGRRIENYVQNRCVFHLLLQVPAITDGGLTEAKEREWEDEDAFSSKILVEIIEESLWVFCEFLFADKDEGQNILNRNKNHQIELLNAESSQLLLAKVQALFQKAERRLKELLKSSNNCSLQNWEKQAEGRMNYALILLIAQVDLTLISKVLRMSKLTIEQLSWCNNKLHQISFVNRKVHLDHSLLLFPF